MLLAAHLRKGFPESRPFSTYVPKLELGNEGRRMQPVFGTTETVLTNTTLTNDPIWRNFDYFGRIDPWISHKCRTGQRPVNLIDLKDDPARRRSR